MTARVIPRIVRASTAMPAMVGVSARIPIAPLTGEERARVWRMRSFLEARKLARTLRELRVADPGGEAAMRAADATLPVDGLLASAAIAPRRSIGCELNVETRNESNRRGHLLGEKQRRAKVQKRDVPTLVRSAFVGDGRPPVPVKRVVLVTLTRVSPDGLDDDGLVRSMKHVRDAIARWVLLLDDADPRLRFDYEQCPGPRVSMRVLLEWDFGG